MSKARESPAISFINTNSKTENQWAPCWLNRHCCETIQPNEDWLGSSCRDLKFMAWLWESEKELNSTIITLYWKQWHQTDEIMNSSVSNTDQAALKGPGVWAAQGKEWFDHEEALYLHPLGEFFGQEHCKSFPVFSPIWKDAHNVSLWRLSLCITWTSDQVL